MSHKVEWSDVNVFLNAGVVPARKVALNSRLLNEDWIAKLMGSITIVLQYIVRSAQDLFIDKCSEQIVVAGPRLVGAGQKPHRPPATMCPAQSY